MILCILVILEDHSLSFVFDLKGGTASRWQEMHFKGAMEMLLLGRCSDLANGLPLILGGVELSIK